MQPTFVYTHNATAGTEQLMRVGGDEESVEFILEAAAIMYEVSDTQSLVDGQWIRVITLTPAPFKYEAYVSLLDELRPLFRTLRPDQSVAL